MRCSAHALLPRCRAGPPGSRFGDAQRPVEPGAAASLGSSHTIEPRACPACPTRRDRCGLAGLGVVRADTTAAGEPDDGDDPVAAGRQHRQRRHGRRHHRAPGVRGAPTRWTFRSRARRWRPCRAEGGLVFVDDPDRRHRRQPQRPVRARLHRHRRRRVPGHGRRGRATHRRGVPGPAARCTCGPTSARSAPTSSASPAPPGPWPPEKRPQVAGRFHRTARCPEPPRRRHQIRAGRRAIDIDTRFITTPTALKLAVMILGVACVLASIVALALLDRASADGSRPPRRRRRVGLSTWLADAGVIGALLVWHRGRRRFVRRRLQPDHRPGFRRRRLHHQLLPLLRRPRRPRSTGIRACWRTWRRSAPPESGCGCPPPPRRSAPG